MFFTCGITPIINDSENYGCVDHRFEPICCCIDDTNRDARDCFNFRSEATYELNETQTNSSQKIISRRDKCAAYVCHLRYVCEDDIFFRWKC